MPIQWITSKFGSGNYKLPCGQKRMPLKFIIIFLNIFLSFDSAMCAIATPEKLPKYFVCNTTECHKIAQRFKQVMNFSVSPCDDFSSFVCGENSNALAILSNTVLLRTIRLLEKPVIHEAKSTVDSARSLFQGCMDSVDVNESSLVDSAIGALRNFGGVPLIPDSEYDPSLNWMARLAIIYRQLPINAIFGFEIVQDLLHEAPKYISFSQIQEFGILTEEAAGSDGFANKKLTIYRMVIKGFVCFLRRTHCAEKDDANVDDDIKKLVDFEIKIATLVRIWPKESRIWKRYKKHQIKYLMEKIPEFDWMAFVKELFLETNISASKETEVVFMDMEHFIGLRKIINETDPKTIANYLGWRIIKKLPILNTNAFRKFIVKFAPTLPMPHRVSQTRLGSLCAQKVTELFPQTVGKLYVEQHFRAIDKEKIEKMADGILRAMKIMIQKNTWMDQMTKVEAIKKIINMEHFIAYPSWISDEKLIDQLEGLPEPCHRNKYLSSLVRTYHYKQCKELSEIKHLTKKDRWIYSAADMRAYYNPLQNSLYVAAGISQPPYYYTNSFDALIYGAQGYVIGHELSHVIDKIGKNFDGNGVLRSWWTNSTTRKFDEEAECFVEQYGSIVDKKTKLRLNGRQTLIENLADNGGLHRAYEAYMMTSPKDTRLPGLENLSHKQLFFIAFGRSSCQVQNEVLVREIILTNNHLPRIYRIAIPPRNLKAFAEVFNCPKGSSMNPDKRCLM